MLPQNRTQSSSRQPVVALVTAMLCLFAVQVPAAVSQGPMLPQNVNIEGQNVPPAKFYEESKRGWFWYETKPERSDFEQPEELIPHTQMVTPDNPVVSKSEKQETVIEKVAIDVLWNMYPDDFQALLTKQMKKAVQYPTEHNVTMYYRTQDVARRKALAFTNSAMMVVQKNANTLGLNQVIPANVPGNLAKVQMRENEISQIITEAHNDHALLFFVQPGCSFCQKQTEILVYFARKYGWEIKPIDITKSNDIALRFDIQTTPSIILIKKDEQNYIPISVGVEALSTIEQKIYRSVRYLRGDTNSENFTTSESEQNSGLDPASILNQQ